MAEGIKRHHTSYDENHLAGNIANALLRIVDQRNYRRQNSQQYGHDKVRCDSSSHQLPCGILCFFTLVRAQRLTDHDRHCAAHGHEDHFKQVAHRRGNVCRSDDIEATNRVALHQKSHAGRPEELIDQERHTLFANGFKQVHRNICACVYTANERKVTALHMRIDDDDRRLHVSREHSRYRSAGYAELRETKLTKDQQVVEHKIGQNTNDARHHRQLGLSHFAQCTGIYLRHSERQQSPQHHK